MKNESKKFTWIHTGKDGKWDGIGPSDGFVFEVEGRKAESESDMVLLCGNVDRAYDLLHQKLMTYVNQFKKEFLESDDEAAAKLVIQQCIEEGLTADLIPGQRGINPKAVKYDEIASALNNPAATLDDKLAALRAQGFNL